MRWCGRAGGLPAPDLPPNLRRARSSEAEWRKRLRDHVRPVESARVGEGSPTTTAPLLGVLEQPVDCGGDRAGIERDDLRPSPLGELPGVRGYVGEDRRQPGGCIGANLRRVRKAR